MMSRLPDQVPTSHALGLPHRLHFLSESIHVALARATRRVRMRANLVARQLRSFPSDRWFLIGFVLLMLAFVALLFLEPGSVGRGGR